MSNMNLIKQDILPAIKNETDRIISKYGKGYNSNHEFYAVLKEEMEEADYEVLKFKEIINISLWHYIKSDSDIKTSVDYIKQYATNAIAELVQVIAVCNRFQVGKLNGEV